MLKNKVISLIGMPGAGKSFIGEKLADLLDWTFIELDLEIEKQEQKSIPAIFAEKGEVYFRKLEQRVLHQALKKQKIVISTGGGTPCFFDNLERIKEVGLSVFLATDSKQILTRILAVPLKRPLFEGMTKKEIQEKIDTLYKERVIYYQKADLSVNSITEERILQEIMDFITKKTNK